jgi:hypothetical protein
MNVLSTCHMQRQEPCPVAKAWSKHVGACARWWSRTSAAVPAASNLIQLSAAGLAELFTRSLSTRRFLHTSTASLQSLLRQ